MINRATAAGFTSLSEDDQKIIRVLLVMRGVNCRIVDLSEICCHYKGGCRYQTETLLFCVNESSPGRLNSVVLVKPCKVHMKDYLASGWQEL